MAVPDDTQSRSDFGVDPGSRAVIVRVAWSELAANAAAAPIDGVIGEMSREHALTQLAAVGSLRNAAPRVPLLVVVDQPGAALLDALHLLDVTVCGRPLAQMNLQHFVDRALQDAALDDRVLHARVKRESNHKGLTRRESELLRLATSGIPRRLIAVNLGVSENTVKAQIRSLLRKTGARNLAVLGQQLLRGEPTKVAVPTSDGAEL